MPEKKKNPKAAAEEKVKAPAKTEKKPRGTAKAKAAKAALPDPKTEAVEELVSEATVEKREEPQMEAEKEPVPAKEPVLSRESLKKGQREKKNPNVVSTLIGNFSEDIVSENAIEKSSQEWENENFRKLKRFEKDGEILWATVYGVEIMGNHVAVCAMWNGCKVIIPGELYFEPNYDFGKNFAGMTPEEKLRKLGRVAKYQQGAKICFVVLKADREEIPDGQFKGQYMISVIGSRVQAMKVLRDIYFWHENRKDSKTAPRSIGRGDIVSANVLAVKEDTVLIECAGVETRLGSHNLLQGDIVTNCCNYVKPGDRIRVRVKEVILNKDKTVHLSVTGRTDETSKMIGTIKIGSTYLGKVESYNAAKGTYHVILANGVPATVPKANVGGHIELFRGDRVSFHVSNVYETFVSGSVLKI